MLGPPSMMIATLYLLLLRLLSCKLTDSVAAVYGSNYKVRMLHQYEQNQQLLHQHEPSSNQHDTRLREG